MKNYLAISWLIILFFAASCGEKAAVYSPVEVEPLPVSVASKFGANLEKSINAGEAEMLDNAFNINALLDISFADRSQFPDQEVAFRDALLNSMKPGARTAEIIKAGGDFRFIRAYEGADKNSHIIYRVSSKTGLEDYHDYRLASSVGEEKAVLIVDLYSYRTNQWLSENYRDVVLSLRESISNKDPDGNSYAESLAKIEKIADLAATSKFPQIVKEYETLNPHVQGLKPVMLYRLIGSMFVGTAEFEAALQAFMEKYPKDKAIGFNLMSIFLEEKGYAEVLSILETLENDLGVEDAYIASAKANIYFSQGELEAAEQAAERAKTIEPDYEAAHWILLNIHVRARDFAEAAEDLKILHYEFDVHPDQLQKGEEFADFVESAHFKAVAGKF